MTSSGDIRITGNGAGGAGLSGIDLTSLTTANSIVIGNNTGDGMALIELRGTTVTNNINIFTNTGFVTADLGSVDVGDGLVITQSRTSSTSMGVASRR